MENNCIFCKIANGEAPCYKIYENEYVVSFLDISKDVFGHTLVVPKNHCENIFDCDEKFLSETIKAVKLISNHYRKLGFDGVNILNASGASAQQSVFHLHFHIIPRKTGDTLDCFPKFAGTNIDFETQLEKLKLDK